MLLLNFEVVDESTIHDTCRQAAELAHQLNVQVRFQFNEVELVVRPIPDRTDNIQEWIDSRAQAAVNQYYEIVNEQLDEQLDDIPGTEAHDSQFVGADLAKFNRLQDARRALKAIKNDLPHSDRNTLISLIHVIQIHEADCL